MQVLRFSVCGDGGRLCGALSPADSAPFSVLVGAAAALSLRISPAKAQPGQPLGQQPVIIVVDAGGNLVTDSEEILAVKLFCLGPFQPACEADLPEAIMPDPGPTPAPVADTVFASSGSVQGAGTGAGAALLGRTKAVSNNGVLIFRLMALHSLVIISISHCQPSAPATTA